MVERKQQGAEQQQRQQGNLLGGCLLPWPRLSISGFQAPSAESAPHLNVMLGWLVGWLVVSPRPSLTTATHSLRVRKVPGSWSWSLETLEPRKKIWP